MEHIAQRLKELRKRKGLSLQELSYKVGLSVATLSRIETNPEAHRLGSFKVLANFYGISLEKLFSLRENELNEIFDKMKILILSSEDICDSKLFSELTELVRKKEKRELNI